MNENDRTTLEQAIYEEMELTPEMIRSIRTLCGVCLLVVFSQNPRRSKSPLFPAQTGAWTLALSARPGAVMTTL